MTKAVIFDIGGVLACDVWEHLLPDENGVRSLFPVLARAELERIGPVLWEAFAYVPETPAVGWRELELRYWRMFIEYFKSEIGGADPDDFIELTDSFIRPMPKMRPILERLSATGTQLAICSNNNEFWFMRQMDKLELHQFFSPSKAVLSCRVGVPKASDRFEMFHAVCDAVATPMAECLFIDDREPNIAKARSCGMAGIRFKCADDLDRDLIARGL